MTYKIIWFAKPSPILNFGTYLICLMGLFFLNLLAHAITPYPYHLLYTAAIHHYYPTQFFFLLSIFLSMAGLILFALFSFFTLYFTSYWLTTDRLFIKNLNWFSIQIDEIELYRIYEYSMKKNLFLCLFGLGSILLRSNDTLHANLQLRGLKKTEEITETLRFHIEKIRDEKGVHDLNIHNISPQ